MRFQKKKLSQSDQRFKSNARLSKSCPIGDRVLVREGGGPFWIELSFFLHAFYFPFPEKNWTSEGIYENMADDG